MKSLFINLTTKSKNKIILAIETSCDDTGVAILQFSDKKAKVLINLLSSQIKTHAPFGGVVPNLAAREHQKNLPILLAEAFKRTKLVPDTFAVAQGPGLIPALLVGVTAAKVLSLYWQKPLAGVNHLKGHLAASLIAGTRESFVLRDDVFPALALVVSGGHTEIVWAESWKKLKIIGETRDDAAGEAFDKASKLLNLGYPGGPMVSQRASRAKNPDKYPLPRPMISQANFDFSFSGLKTALLYLVKDLQKRSQKLSPATVNNLCASFESAAIETLAAKTERALKKFSPKTLILSGGVAANNKLREALRQIAGEKKVEFLTPSVEFCTDNALMIALAAWLDAQNGIKPKKWNQIKANANLRF